MLHRWLNTPHVLEWWDRPGPTPDQVRAKYLPRTAGPDDDVTPYIIRLGEAAIGYIQLYPVRAGMWPLPNTEPGIGIDVFIGDSRYVHRGLGPRILRRFLKDIVFRDQAVDKSFVDPSTRNRVAIRAFEKAGFRRVGTATDPDSGAAVDIMRITRKELEDGSAD